MIARSNETTVSSARKRQPYCISTLLATFLFDTAGAKRKVSKRETPRLFRALRSATKATRLGWAPPGGGAANALSRGT